MHFNSLSMNKNYLYFVLKYLQGGKMKKLFITIAFTLLAFTAHAHTLTLKKGMEIQNGYYEAGPVARFIVGVKGKTMGCDLELSYNIPVSNGILQKDVIFDFDDLSWGNDTFDGYPPERYLAILRFFVKSSNVIGPVTCVDEDTKPVMLMNEKLAWKILLSTPIKNKAQVVKTMSPVIASLK
jgi:hypothetical protein